MAAGTLEVDIKGLEGNEAAQPRVFAHNATKILEASIIGATPTGQNIVAPPDDTNVVISRGACIYIGIACDLTVVMEGQPANTALADGITFKGCTAGSFLPVLVTKILRITKTDGTDYSATEVGDGTILALF
tara:strand:+ start:2886 stop:3281 length:396 start_codon:yes stop_codon:yes gene_type:complete